MKFVKGWKMLKADSRSTTAVSNQGTAFCGINTVFNPTISGGMSWRAQCFDLLPWRDSNSRKYNDSEKQHTLVRHMLTYIQKSYLCFCIHMYRYVRWSMFIYICWWCICLCKACACISIYDHIYVCVCICICVYVVFTHWFISTPTSIIPLPKPERGPGSSATSAGRHGRRHPGKVPFAGDPGWGPFGADDGWWFLTSCDILWHLMTSHDILWLHVCWFLMHDWTFGW